MENEPKIPLPLLRLEQMLSLAVCTWLALPVEKNRKETRTKISANTNVVFQNYYLTRCTDECYK